MMMNNAVKKVLFAREAPYVATLFVGLVAWILTHLAERLVQTPILDYEWMRQELSSQDKTDSRIFPPKDPNVTSEEVHKDVFRVTNISQSARFRKITFYLDFPSNSPSQDQMRFAWTSYNLPAVPRTKAAADKKSELASCDPKLAWYPVQELHPGWSVDLICYHTGEAKPGLGFNTDDVESAVRLLEKGCSTSLVRNESVILLWLLIVSVILMIAYLTFINMTSPPT
jgi:hypothetical protein